MSFAVAAEAYDRFMGRYSNPLAPLFADFAGIAAGQRVVDVGAGPGALTEVLAERLGADAVTAVEPSEPFVEALRERHPGVTVLHSGAENLPLEDASVDTSMAQLVVHFMTDPVRGLAEMRRVTVPGGVVAANVWDHGGGNGPLSAYWEAVRELDPSNAGEGHLAGATQGDLTRLFEEAGLSDVEEESLTVTVEHETFEEWWEPYTLGVGPAGAYAAGLTPEARDALRERCRERLPGPPYVVSAGAWSARARA
jgi:ubiquinone/menaquinone biosynthesis C-methylase UbiE